MSDEVKICAVCGKEYRRKYHLDYIEDQWWQSMSHTVAGGVCGPRCAEKTPAHIRDQRQTRKFYQSLTPEQQKEFWEMLDMVRDYEFYELSSLFSNDPIPDELASCHTCGKIFKLSDTVAMDPVPPHTISFRQCKACHDEEKESHV